MPRWIGSGPAGYQVGSSVTENRDLEEIRPPWAEAVTVEVLARWAHQRLAPTIRATGGETLTVRVWESPVDSAAYAGPVSTGGVP